MAMKVDQLDELAKDLVKQYKTKEALFGENWLYSHKTHNLFLKIIKLLIGDALSLF